MPVSLRVSQNVDGIDNEHVYIGLSLTIQRWRLPVRWKHVFTASKDEIQRQCTFW